MDQDYELQKNKLVCNPEVFEKLTKPQVTLFEVVDEPGPKESFHWIDFLIGMATTLGGIILINLLNPKKKEEEELIDSPRPILKKKPPTIKIIDHHGKRRNKSEDSDGDE